jgi:hypothetical protein
MNTNLLGALGIGSTIAGAETSAQGAAQLGTANSAMYSYQAGIANLNKSIDLQNQEFAAQTGEQQAQSFGIQEGQQLGQIKAAQASSGFDVNSGSSAQVRASQRQIGSVDTAIIRSNAAKTAYNYELQGTVAGAQSSLYTMASTNAAQAGSLSAEASILGGAASVSNQWLQAGNVGLFTTPTTPGGSTSSSSTTTNPASWALGLFNQNPAAIGP